MTTAMRNNLKSSPKNLRTRRKSDDDDDEHPPALRQGKNNTNKCIGEIKCPTQQDETATTTEDDDDNDEEGEGR